jgi:thiamine kinase-like enzyme
MDVINLKKLKKRVTHNDTKINNLLLSADGKRVLALIDLDTVMPGTILFDYGDAVRSICNLGDEDEILEKNFSLKHYKAFKKGFLKETASILTVNELSYLHISPLLITYELGLRFLTDYLNDDKYFKTHYPKQNLKRAQTHIKLYNEMLKELIIK